MQSKRDVRFVDFDIETSVGNILDDCVASIDLRRMNFWDLYLTNVSAYVRSQNQISAINRQKVSKNG